MPLYAYRCEDCKAEHEPFFPIDGDLPVHIACSCGGRMRRRFTPPAFHRFAEHFNHTVGEGVSSKKEFATKLYEAQEKMTERLGWQQHYAVADPQPITYEDKGMDATHDVRKASGLST